MVRVTFAGLCIALGFSAVARAADQPLYDPPPSWVRSLAIPGDGKASGAAIDVLLFTSQARLAPGVTETFVESARRINSPEGLGAVASLSEVWDPATESLIVHRAQIIRAGKAIDLLANGRKFTVLRRETNLEAASIDGALTANLQPEGLQVGDVLDFAVTRIEREPALAGHAEALASLDHSGTIGRLYVSMAWPSHLPIRLWRTDDLPALAPVADGAWTKLELDQTNAVSPDAPSGAPPFEQTVGVLQASDFASWRAVSAAAFPLYERAATLNPDSPLLAEVARIGASSADPKVRALAALKLVEDQTRYFYVGLDAGGFTPAPADLTWSRRFGDCKGKSVLLLAILKRLGIEAAPALVDTDEGDGLDRRAPRFHAFDHVIVRAEIAGRVYWLDGTRIGDESLDITPIPNYHWALPLRAEGADLEPLHPATPSLPLAEMVEEIDARAGIEKPATINKALIARGDAALSLDLALKQDSGADREQALKQMLTAGRGWIKPDTVAFTYDPLKMEGRATLKGTGILPFTSAEGAADVRDWVIDGASVGSTEDLTRVSDYHRDAPYAVSYPAYTRAEVEVQLPDEGKNFEVVNGETVDRTVGGRVFTRAAALTGGRLTMMASTRAIAPTFPASEASSTQAALRDLASYSVSVRYTAPSAKDAADANAKTLAAIAATAGRTPLETARAAFTEKNYAVAEAAFTTALEATPTAKLYYDRAAARAALGKDDLAKADLQAAIKLDPKDSYALFALGRLDLLRGDSGGASKHFSAAQAASPYPDRIAERIATAYDDQDRYAQAFPFWDQVISATSAAEPRASALGASCRSRARAGKELGRALKDCDTSLQLHPDAAKVLDSRGLAYLRSGAPEKALADFDAALTHAPKMSTSVFGRALAEATLGQSEKAAADFAQARLIDPKVDALFEGWGLKP
jgi:tetratricopeptide (TPR) repeat protein